MEEVKASRSNRSSVNVAQGGWFLVVEKNGTLRCSCGSELIKMDEDTYVCGAGYPVYRISGEEVVIDKFGNLYMRAKPHNQNKDKKKYEKGAKEARSQGKDWLGEDIKGGEKVAKVIELGGGARKRGKKNEQSNCSCGHSHVGWSH